MLEEKSYFTIDDMKTALSKIISQIESSNFTPEIIFSINRGGCIPGVYLSHAINVQHKVIDVQLRDDTNSPNLEPLTNIIYEKAHGVKLIFLDMGNNSVPALELIQPVSKKSKVYNYFFTLFF